MFKVIITTILLQIYIGTTTTAQAAECAHQTKQMNTNTAHIAILYSDTFLLHDTGPGHPERAERLKAIIDHIRQDPQLAPALVWPPFKPASLDAVKAVHTTSYVELVQQETARIAAGDRKQISTGDTILCAHTWEAALLAAGASVAAVDHVMRGLGQSAFALVRPPGHHATPDRGMGFCVFNNIAIAARHAQKQHGIERVLIVDIDVHHGNGTQDIFYADDTVFFFCVHQHPLYPRTGRPSETGQGCGKGFTLNVDLPRGAGDEAILAAFRDKLTPAMESFQPGLVLVSAGFDGHTEDPLGGLQYTDAGYASMAQELRALADQYTDGRIVFILEGGYSTEASARSIANILNILRP